MRLREHRNFIIDREHRFIRVELLQPHWVLSTCALYGGLRNDLRYILNVQTCEGSSLHPRTEVLMRLNQAEQHALNCRDANLDSSLVAQLGTAANMDYVAIREASYEDAQVTVAATAGVEGNAGRAGDPAQWHEGEKAYVPVHATPGTINIILLCHQSLSLGALARCAVTLTEAKSAALADLAVPSRYSAHLATGTGTDQFAVACPQEDSPRFHWTGNHAKLGELIGQAVHDAVLEALHWQNGLDAHYARNLFHALGRFGLHEKEFRKCLTHGEGDEAQRKFLLDSIPMVIHDPRVSACAYALAAILDRKAAGSLPEASAQEAILWQCALLASALAGKPDAFVEFLPRLSALPVQATSELLMQTILWGWETKWA